MIVPGNGIQIAYDDVGTGMPVLFLHPFPLDRSYWAPQLAALVTRCRCIAPDSRGFGDTAATPPYSMDRYAADAVALLDRLEIDRAVVAGLSIGGYVAFALWRNHPERIRALVLADTRAGADGDEAREKRRALIALARDRGTAAVADAQLPGLVGKRTREKQPDVIEALRHSIERASVAGITGALEAMMARPDSTPTLATITVPTLIVVGEDDALTPPKEARAMHESIPRSRLEILAGAGHASSFERAAAFNHVLGEFLDSLVES
ncbi:MAG TPA: alpha/beta fold hydrolase [Gemmatimonadaceae bacterium]|nr:alpha/beta fold hydrolase [Gemmatimonadaceae bacterium]